LTSWFEIFFHILLVLGAVREQKLQLAAAAAAAPTIITTTTATTTSTESDITPTKLGCGILDTPVGADAADGDGAPADDASEVDV
jgi:hypothetical protein